MTKIFMNYKVPLFLALGFLWCYGLIYAGGIHFTPPDLIMNLALYYLIPIYLLCSYFFVKLLYRQISPSSWRGESNQKKIVWLASTSTIYFLFSYCLLGFTVYKYPNILAVLLEGTPSEREVTVKQINPTANYKSCKGTEISFNEISKTCFHNQSLANIHEGSTMLVSGKNVMGGFLAEKYQVITSQSNLTR